MGYADYIRSRQYVGAGRQAAIQPGKGVSGNAMALAAFFTIIVIAHMILCAPEATAAAGASKEDLRLKIYDSRVSSTAMILTYEAKNISNKALWICVGNNDQRIQPYETITSSKNGSLKIRLMSATIPKGHVPDMPIMGKYKKLLPGFSITFTLNLKSPVTDFEPIGGEGSNRINIKSIKTVELVLGYFRADLEAQQKCCTPATRAGEILVDSLWAASSKEASHTLSISRKRRWK